ncbi:hypothetical protein [Psychrobium sp. 1_MG-2023]|uniref:hypothetical protein n=1 Tax=Psychrobium sp. 1_MG-2023 TaxID=3062624 RepID=UPI000C34113F|nr:hypothetical protein [Psychrobium sp. 1_MG-2023]MDP2559769.1 hypothetical protein [Psychrobium sp. 1_MG-2023]PKF59123.1 hypothetical protein CW748_02740 [Alteromonadales bacterium alter-6D02]
MKKSDKKIESRLVKQLRVACDELKGACDDFLWLSHQVNYQSFPQSLEINVMFAEFADIEQLSQSCQGDEIRAIIASQLIKADIRLPKPQQQIVFNQ